ncbi:single-stranded DNA-binding protein [Lactobacillaceae bacterium 24-114]
MINRAVLTGRLTKDPELRYTTSGTAVVSFTLAVDRQFRNQNGDRDADFINCVIWRKSAENFSNFTHKGSLVGIEGRIQTRNYENQQGNRVYVTEVVVDNFALLEPRQQNGGNQQPFGQGQPQYNNAQPQFGNNAPQANSSNDFENSQPSQPDNIQFPENGNDGQSIDLSDDELPF